MIIEAVFIRYQSFVFFVRNVKSLEDIWIELVKVIYGFAQQTIKIVWINMLPLYNNLNISQSQRQFRQLLPSPSISIHSFMLLSQLELKEILLRVNYTPNSYTTHIENSAQIGSTVGCPLHNTFGGIHSVWNYVVITIKDQANIQSFPGRFLCVQFHRVDCLLNRSTPVTKMRKRLSKGKISILHIHAAPQPIDLSILYESDDDASFNVTLCISIVSCCVRLENGIISVGEKYFWMILFILIGVRFLMLFGTPMTFIGKMTAYLVSTVCHARFWAPKYWRAQYFCAQNKLKTQCAQQGVGKPFCIRENRRNPIFLMPPYDFC